MPLPSARVVHQDRTCEVAGVLDAAKDLCGTIKRRVTAKSAGGGDTETLRTIATGVPFRARNASDATASATVGDTATESTRWLLSFPRGTNIQAITDRVYADGGRVWDVLEVGGESYEPEMRIIAVEVAR